MEDLTLVIMAAGMGSRFGGAKQVEPVDMDGNFILDYSIYDAMKAGFNKVVFIIKEEDKEVFESTIGKRLEGKIDVEYAFQKIRNVIDVSDSGYAHARLYDFRHTFATRTIKRWYEQGEDINSKLYLLSTYLGHAHPEDTYWYLSATPELMCLASEKYEALYGGDYHE